MKPKNMNISKVIAGLIAICLLSVLSACKRAEVDQEGNSLKVVKIGNQKWMAENLTVSHFRNGDSIPEARTQEEWIRFGSEGTPAFLTDKVSPENARKYGKLYNWYAVNDPRGLAPKGWHVPSHEEWSQLTSYFGGEVAAALSIRAMGFDEDGQITSESGFTGLPAGFCAGDGKFYGTGTNGYWWSSTEINPLMAYAYLLNYLHCNTYNLNYHKTAGLSVRCIKD